MPRRRTEGTAPPRRNRGAHRRTPVTRRVRSTLYETRSVTAGYLALVRSPVNATHWHGRNASFILGPVNERVRKAGVVIAYVVGSIVAILVPIFFAVVLWGVLTGGRGP